MFQLFLILLQHTFGQELNTSQNLALRSDVNITKLQASLSPLNETEGYIYWGDPNPIDDDPKWMEKAMHHIEKKTLLELTLPGTHDSASYNLTKSILPSAQGTSWWGRTSIQISEMLGIPVDRVITSWAITQDHNIYE